MQSQQYIPVFDRPLPEKKPDPPKPEDIEDEKSSENSEDDTKVKKKSCVQTPYRHPTYI